MQEVVHSHDRGGIKRWIFLGGKVVGCLVIAVTLFSLGVGVGNGSINVGRASAQHKNLPTHLDYSSVNQVYQILRANYDGKLTEAQLLDGLKAGLAESTGDPYTEYFNTSQAKTFNDQLNGTFSGVGAELGQDAQGNLIVVAPIDGFPAAKAGLRPQDIIVSIDGKSTTGLSIDEAVSKIRGPKGTQVTLKVVRSKNQALSFTITREDITVPSVKSEILDGNIGYMQINQFTDDTGSLAQEGAQNFKDHGVKGVILDLRGNPGGLVDAAVSVSSLWLPQGKLIMQEKSGATVLDTEVATGNNILQGVPTAVLIDAGSASASEITASALKDSGAATLFGVKSYGKGVVQQVEPLPGGAELKVTIAHWYRPNGQNIDKKGIVPDHVIQLTDEEIKNKNDLQKEGAIQYLENLTKS